jgi:UDP-glucose:(heptosyl)LPS alpha-1,3-glucosyltransferase
MPERDKPRIAVVSPFLDKRHGTERCVAEQVERLAREYEVHVYSNRVEDVDLSEAVWHRVPALPGPHLFAYIWWFAMNHFKRWGDRRFRGLKYDLVYTPCINCLDADLISVHIVFSEFYERVYEDLKFSRNPARSWPRIAHRRLYYMLVKTLERWVYCREYVPLVVISQKVAADIHRYCARDYNLAVSYYGCDPVHFSPERRGTLRHEARSSVGLDQSSFAVLLIGNDWKKKGLPCLLEAVGQLAIAQLKVLVVGNDTRSPYMTAIQAAGLEDRVQFLPLRKDVEFYYAAADAYVGPSLEDAFALPPLEAMASGLPVIVSRQAGVSEVITHGTDGFILEDPRDAGLLASLIGDLYRDAALRQRVGEMAAKTALKFSWDRNADELRAVIEKLLAARAEGEGSPAPVRC